MTSSPKVTHRVAQQEDLPLLIQFREECGWGAAAVQRNFSDPDRIFCIFIADIDGEMKDVGMGCWYLNQPDDLELASRDTSTIHIASLYILKKYQGRKFGTSAMDLLERIAVFELDAKIVTLDTTAYTTKFVQYDGKQWFEEDFEKPGRTRAWYQARGYKQFRDHRRLFPHPTPTDPNRLLTAIFLSKSAEVIRSEQDKLIDI